ncbi:MAG TPA: O-methyltransferase [Vicinamibacterales bacterium]|nr:O-methyltransferase [Vicinamibacterales bacterium]
MGDIVPDSIEHYLAHLNRLTDPLLVDIAREGRDQGLPIVDPEVGGLLRVLATAIGARRMLEVGTAIGYSGIWLAGALPADGMLMTMEVNPERAAVARKNFERAGLADRTSVMVGDAALLVAKVAGPFDLIFQDGAKTLYGRMLDRLVNVLRPGGLLITDNVLWGGEVVPGHVAAPSRNTDDTRAIADYNERLVSDERLRTTVLPLRDGVAVSVKVE